jgi:protein TonB
MTRPPNSPPERTLGDTLILSCALCALGVLSASFLRERPQVPAGLENEPAKVAKPALVKLDPAKLRVAPTTPTPIELPSVPTPPVALRPISALPQSSLPNLPALPALPVVDAKNTGATTTAPGQATTGTAQPGPTTLTMGEGEGHQPWPEYPGESLRRREYGAVQVRFSVLRTGEVAEARVISSSGWPRLDRAATATILGRWQFPAGEPREYQVTIQFQIR